jgi:hypothetical protein
MLPDSPPAAIPAPDIPASTPPGLIALFVAFAKMSLAGFGGVLVWARRGIVDQHRWMTADQFNETYALPLSSSPSWPRYMRATAKSTRCGAFWPACPARRSACCYPPFSG